MKFHCDILYGSGGMADYAECVSRQFVSQSCPWFVNSMISAILFLNAYFLKL